MDLNRFQPESISSNERLRRAIERNRAKQARRAETELQTPRKQPVVTNSPATRRGIARPEEVEFVSQMRQPKRQAPASISYTPSHAHANYQSSGTRTIATPKFPGLSQKWTQWRGRLVLALFSLLIARLIFSDGGILDYREHMLLKNQKAEEARLIREDNQAIDTEIEKIKHDQAYQKQLVREQLGFIEDDEYLLLFVEAKAQKSK